MSSEEFVIDASGTLDDSDSESDAELPTYQLPLFKKYLYDRIVEAHNRETVQQQVDPNGNVDTFTESSKSRLVHQKKIMEDSLAENDKKSVVAMPEFETMEKVPTFLSRRQSRKLRMKEKAKTKGFHWYNMRAPELKEEQKNDLMVVQMRQALNKKHFYKRSGRKTNPKYFEIGTYAEAPIDFYSSRIPKKQRKKTLVEEVMADMEFS